MQTRASGRRLLDASQDDSQRSEIRQRLQELRESTDKQRDLLASEAERFQGRLAAHDELYQKVLFPSEAVFDAEQLKLMAEIGAEQGRRVNDHASSRMLDSFCRKVQALLLDAPEGDQNLPIGAIGRVFAKHVKIAPGLCTMKAALKKTVQERKRAAGKKKVDSNAQTVRPQERTEFAEDEKTQTDERVKSCFEKLIEVESCDLMQFAVNPESFSETVENFFDVSFLVRQNRAGFKIEPDGRITIEIREEPTEEDIHDEGLRNSQAIWKLDVPTFQEWIRKYNLNAENAPLVGRRKK